MVSAIEIADLNGDGRDDVAVGTGAAADRHRIHVYLQSAAGTLDAATDHVLPRPTVSSLGFHAISAADLNGDLLLDLVAGNNELFMLLQNPSAPGTFEEPIRYAAQR